VAPGWRKDIYQSIQTYIKQLKQRLKKEKPQTKNSNKRKKNEGRARCTRESKQSKRRCKKRKKKEGLVNIQQKPNQIQQASKMHEMNDQDGSHQGNRCQTMNPTNPAEKKNKTR
jgi:hypothetical protein